MSTGWKLENSYATLQEIFYSRQLPVPVKKPKLVMLNDALAISLGLDPRQLRSEAEQVFSGNALPAHAQPIAQAYAGHQFGHFAMLGDGRAVLLGEQVDPRGTRWDVQLKGSGRTPYSRGGDGRAALGPMLREYLISEAMHALGIPTTRSLAVVATGETVFRETPLPGAILTRVAASHIRVGTFEYAAMKGPEVVKILADYVIHRHYPEIKEEDRPYEKLLKKVISRQAVLIADWMRVGFIHGVMNTDNMAISGETIDYGPCAFMDHYNLATIFSSIDRQGRYAYGNQPGIAQWNLTRFAETLVPLLDPNQETAIELAKECLSGFGKEFTAHWLTKMRGKIGLSEPKPEDDTLIQDLLTWLQQNKVDHTDFFRSFSLGKDPGARDITFDNWKSRYINRRDQESQDPERSRHLMLRSNPNIIPRNHHVEAALSSAVDLDDLEPFLKFVTELQNPYEDRPEHLPYLALPPKDAENYRTFCGT